MSSTVVTVRMSPTQFEMHKKALRIAAKVALAYGRPEGRDIVIACCRKEFLTVPAGQQFLNRLRALNSDLGYGISL